MKTTTFTKSLTTLEKTLDSIFEQITKILGSTIVIIGFGAWMVYHNVTGRVYVNFISDLAIFVGFLILRGQNIQSERMERNIDRTKKDTQLDLKKSDELMTELRSQK